MSAPVLAVGDGALGFWAALREVFPGTREQRCWFHKQANVLSALPKSAHPGALAALKDIYNAEDIDQAQVAAKAFELDCSAKYPKAVAKLTDDLDTLLEFYKYPAEHRIHLRTTNPVESTFATVRLRQRVTKGPGSRAAGIAMAYKLIEAAQTRWRKVNAPELVALVRAGTLLRSGLEDRGATNQRTASTVHGSRQSFDSARASSRRGQVLLTKSSHPSNYVKVAIPALPPCLSPAG